MMWTIKPLTLSTCCVWRSYLIDCELLEGNQHLAEKQNGMKEIWPHIVKYG